MDDTEQLEQALSRFDDIRRQHPNDATIFCEKGIILHRLHRPEEAFLAFEEALKMQPDLARAYCGEGIIFAETQRYQDALSAFEQTIKYDPTYIQAYKNKAGMLVRMKRYKEAVPALERALELDPSDKDIARMLANVKRYRSRQAHRKISGCYMELWRIYYAIIISGTGLVIAAFCAQVSFFLGAFMLLLTIGAVLVLLLKTFR